MIGYIDGYNFGELECMKYWQPPSSWTTEKVKQETINRIMSSQWLGSQKRDGALYVFLKDEDGNVTLRGRSKSVNGVYLDKWDHVPHLHSWAKLIPNGTCFLGEIYWKGKEGSHNTTSIMNCLTKKAIERQEKNEDKLIYYIFDVLAYSNKSFLKVVAEERFNSLYQYPTNQYIEYATYYKGQELWDILQKILAEGYEGIVITKNDALYEPGKRPSKTTLKVKKALKQTLDCFFTGRASAPTRLYSGKDVEKWAYWVDEDTDERLPIGEHYYEAAHEGKRYTAVTRPYYFHWAGSLEIGCVDDKGEIVPIGFLSGLTDEIKMNYKDYTKRTIEVGAMELNDTGGLRHAKMLGWRPDKPWHECSIDQLKEI